MRMTLQEWNALSPEDQRAREAEMPWEIFADKSKLEQERLTNLNIEKDRKLKSALQQVEEMNERIKALEASGAPPSQIKNLEAIRDSYMADLEKDPLVANSRLALTQANNAINAFKESEAIKRTALRKLRKDFPKDYEKFGDELEDMLDKVSGYTAESIVIMFNSLRGKSSEEMIKEAEARGAKKALEEAGIVAVDVGGASGPEQKSTLGQEQQEEMQRMGLSEKDYKELLSERQAKDKAEGRTPRTLINPK